MSEASNYETAKKLGLLEEEFDLICGIMGRKPNFTELSIYSVMWSEHCSYKNSIKWLKTLPRDGERMLAKAGEENAGLVDIGNNLGCAFKIESHNHPSAIEPYQGAATGVGGINRDIFTMGARPIAQLNSLRFGNIELERTKWIMRGVVKGIGNYGNAFGVPTVGGEVFFDDCFTVNPLVNAMSAGIVEKDKTVKAIAYGKGNPVFIVGSHTGKDGIHGATFASGDITEDSAKDLPSVQVGDPFQEKLLLEASLEAIATKAIIGMQDMGAAGIICSTSEMSAKGEAGMIIHLDRVPTRQDNMKPFEILLSESQERMLIIGIEGEEHKLLEVFEKWDLNCVQIGEVTDGADLEFYMDGELVAKVNADSLVLGGGAPIYDRAYTEPAYYQQYKQFNINQIEEPSDLYGIMLHLLAHPNICSKKWVYEQYDSMVGTVNMSTNNASDAAIVNVKGTDKALALTVDCNSRYVQADPEQGAAIAVSEAARNIVCSGGIPTAITNCLNFGNPYNPEVYWQFVSVIKGMGKACTAFKTPVTGGNVSFYNQSVMNTGTVPVFPTPTIGMLGLLDDKTNKMTLSFKNEGDLIYLLGPISNDIACSQYLYSWHGVKESHAPYFNLDEELEVQQMVQRLIHSKLINAAHDVSDGGLFITLMESGFAGNLGFNVSTGIKWRKDAFLFGEGQSRIMVTVAQDQAQAFESFLLHQQHMRIGTVQAQEVVVDGENYGNIDTLKLVYDNALAKRMEQ